MPERPHCNNPFIIERSEGRATCPPSYSKSFRVSGECADCPRVKQAMIEAVSEQIAFERALTGIIKNSERFGYYRNHR